MNSKLIIVEKNQIALTYSNNRITNFITEHQTYNVNDIYLGKISSILPSIDAAFITLKPSSKNGFIHLDNIKYLKKNQQDFSILETRPKISETVLVQITKEPTSTKGPSLSGEVLLLGKYCSIYPLKSHITLNKTTTNEKDKSYLRALQNILKPNSMGMSVKHNAKYGNAHFLINEVSTLKNRWKKILKNSKQFTAPHLLSKKKSFIMKVLTKLYDPKLDYVAIDSAEGALKLKAILDKGYNKQGKTVTIEFYKNSEFLINRYSLDLVIFQMIKPRVNLIHGSYIVIEKTEALTTIDVNSGSFINFSNSRETILWTNYSAANEILKQIKLRNIGGIIIVDFIDSNEQEDQMKILVYLAKLMKKENISSNIIQISELGLVEITRTRQGQNIYDAFSKKCNSCNGLGYCLKSLHKSYNKKSNLLLKLMPSFSYHLSPKLSNT